MSDVDDAAIAEAAAAATEEVTGEPVAEEKPDTVEATTEQEKTHAEAAAVEKETPAEEVKPEEKELTKEEAEDFGLSAEELEAINADPKLSKQMKSMQRGFTKKTTELADKSKANESDLEMAKWLRENPDKALEIMAEKRGRKLQPTEEKAAVDEAVDSIADDWEKAMGKEAADKFYPLLKTTVEKLFDTQIKPVTATQHQLEEEAAARAYQATVNEFSASVKDKGLPMDDDIQAKMAEKMQVIIPASKDTPLPEDRNQGYGLVMAEGNDADRKVETLKRLRKATATEPIGGTKTVEAEVKAIRPDMTDDEKFATAVALAEAEVQ